MLRSSPSHGPGAWLVSEPRPHHLPALPATACLSGCAEREGSFPARAPVRARARARTRYSFEQEHEHEQEHENCPLTPHTRLAFVTTARCRATPDPSRVPVVPQPPACAAAEPRFPGSIGIVPRAQIAVGLDAAAGGPVGACSGAVVRCETARFG